MPAAYEVMQRLDGFVATFTDANGNPPQAVAEWVEGCKIALRGSSRNQTDWDFIGTSIDLDETEEEIDTGAATVYGILGIATDEDESVTFSWYDVATGTNPTVAGTDLNDAGNLAGSFIVRGATASLTVYGGVVFPGGQSLANGLKIAVTELDEGTAIAANSCRAFVLWRSN